MSYGRWIEPVWYVQAMEYYSAMKREDRAMKRLKETFVHITKQRNPVWEDDILYDCNYRTFWKRRNYEGSERTQQVPRACGSQGATKKSSTGDGRGMQPWCTVPSGRTHPIMRLSHSQSVTQQRIVTTQRVQCRLWPWVNDNMSVLVHQWWQMQHDAIESGSCVDGLGRAS